MPDNTSVVPQYAVLPRSVNSIQSKLGDRREVGSYQMYNALTHTKHVGKYIRVNGHTISFTLTKV